MTKSRKTLAKPKVMASLVNNPGTGTGGYGDNSIQRIYRSESKYAYNSCEKRLAELYDRDAILQQIITDPITESLFPWRETSDALAAIETELDYRRVIMTAGIGARKHGQVLIVPIFETPQGDKVGLSLTIQTALQRRARIRSLMVVEDFETSENIVEDTFSPYHGRPTYYQIGKANVRVHHSRVVPFKGNLTGKPIFESVEDYLSILHLGRQDVSRAVQEANFLVLATDIDELNSLVSAAREVGVNDATLEEYIQLRARSLRCNANNNNAYVIDKEKENVINIAKANINDMVDAVEQMAQFVAGASNIPFSRLFAKLSNGLGNDETDIKHYYQFLRGYRFMVLEPAIVELDKLIQLFNPGLDIGFTWNNFPEEVEMAEIEPEISQEEGMR